MGAKATSPERRGTSVDKTHTRLYPYATNQPVRSVRTLLALLVLLSACAAQAQPELQQVGVQVPAGQGARAAGLGGAGLALQGDGWTRVGAMMQWTSPGVTLGAEQRFGLSELREGSAQGVARRGYTTLGLQAASFGNEAFRSSQFGLVAARRLFPARPRALSVALRADLVSISMGGDYGNGIGWGLSPSVWAEVTYALSVVLEARNVVSGDVSGHEPLPADLRAGIAYLASDRIRLAADLVHDPTFGPTGHVGAEVQIVDVLVARAGIGTDPQQVGLGAGLRIGNLRADLAATRHLLLGWSPSVEVGWSW